MDQSKDAEFPQEIQEILEEYLPSRRDFVARAGKLALGSIAVGTIFGDTDEKTAWAEPAPQDSPPPQNTEGRKIQRVAVIGAGHYHSTAAPGYLKILQDLHVDIVGVHDFDPAIAQNRASLVGSAPYTDYREMVEQTKPEFVLTLCEHFQMPGPIEYLINAGVPFMAEKPWGIDPKTVHDLAVLADKKKAWATFPASMRYGAWAQTAKTMVQNGDVGPISHMLVRFNNPGIQRYIDEGSPWMLHKKTAGGGALLNLGIHGFDLFHYITGEEPEVIAATTSHRFFNLDVEEYAFVILRSSNGTIFLNEASYTYPTTGSDSEHKVAGQKALIREVNMGGEGAQIIAPKRDEIIKSPPGYVGSWPGAVADALDRLGRGEPPAATADDNDRAVRLTFDAYKMAGEKA
jgi:predicted dehydrogenase